jgi:NHL repeat
VLARAAARPLASCRYVPPQIHSTFAVFGPWSADLAGSSSSALWPGYAGEGVSPHSALDLPLSVAVDSAGVVYIADADNGRVRELHP